MNMEYKVQVTRLADGHAEAQVQTAFAQLFRLDTDKAAKALSRLPLVIKEKLTAEQAAKYRDRLQAIGLVAEIHPMLVVAPVPSAPPPPPHEVQSATAPGLQLEPIAAPVVKDAVPEVAARPAMRSPGMAFKIEGRPDFAFLTVTIPANETLKVEASAMATMDSHMTMTTKMRGGLGRLLTGESIFVNEFTAQEAPGDIGIAPAAPGDLAHVYLNGDVIYLQNAAFVACARDVNLETKWQGLVKGFFSGESLFLIRASGQGDLWFNSYGGIIELDLDGDYVVDTGNIVAFTDGLEYRMSKVGGYKSLFFSGEGLVCRFSGKGKVWIQTRAVEAFASWAHQFRPAKGKG
ncbi:MAG: TIGR00266 family protein [Uliginosibacterium sp.]|nr:TIGR00266 family protein [Uliginosibacterium sp.]